MIDKPVPQSDEPFAPMGTFPKDGTRCQLKFEQGGAISLSPFYWGDNLMGAGQCIRGDQNVMSPYLKPVGWRKFPT
jgi:hypothetical protein